MKETKAQIHVVRIPIFFALFILYSIAMGLAISSGWVVLAFIAVVLDLAISPVYTKTSTITKETE